MFVSFLPELVFALLDINEGRVTISVRQMEQLDELLDEQTDTILRIISSEIVEMSIQELSNRPCFLMRSVGQIRRQVVDQLPETGGVHPQLMRVWLRRNLIEKRSQR